MSIINSFSGGGNSGGDDIMYKPLTLVEREDTSEDVTAQYVTGYLDDVETSTTKWTGHLNGKLDMEKWDFEISSPMSLAIRNGYYTGAYNFYANTGGTLDGINDALSTIGDTTLLYIRTKGGSSPLYITWDFLKQCAPTFYYYWAYDDYAPSCSMQGSNDKTAWTTLTTLTLTTSGSLRTYKPTTSYRFFRLVYNIPTSQNCEWIISRMYWYQVPDIKRSSKIKYNISDEIEKHKNLMYYIPENINTINVTENYINNINCTELLYNGNNYSLFYDGENINKFIDNKIATGSDFFYSSARTIYINFTPDLVMFYQATSTLAGILVKGITNNLGSTESKIINNGFIYSNSSVEAILRYIAIKF